jgi:hypothetical protein
VGKRVIAMLAAVAVVAALVAGCGGSDEEESLTKAEFVKRGSKICAKEGKKMGDGLTAYGKKHDLSEPASKADTAELMETLILPGFESELEGLQELPAPEGDESEVEAMLTKFEKGLEDGGGDPTQLFASKDSEFLQATEAMGEYGLEGCGTLFL